MAHAPKKKELLEEYGRLESKCLSRSLSLNSREEILGMYERTLQSAADLSWLEGSTGTQQEQQRLRLVVEGLGRDARAAKLLALVVEYQRWAMKPTWQRPRLADWQRLVMQARRVLPAVVKDLRGALNAGWQQHRQDKFHLDKMERRLTELHWLLGPDMLDAPDYTSRAFASWDRRASA